MSKVANLFHQVMNDLALVSSNYKKALMKRAMGTKSYSKKTNKTKILCHDCGDPDHFDVDYSTSQEGQEKWQRERREGLQEEASPSTKTKIPSTRRRTKRPKSS